MHLPLVIRKVLITIVPVALGIASVAMVDRLVDANDKLNNLEGDAGDALQLSLPRIPADPRIVLIVVEDETSPPKQKITSHVGFSKAKYADIVKALSKANPTAIVVDIRLSERDSKSDSYFREVLRSSSAPVVLSAEPIEGDRVEMPDMPGGYGTYYKPLNHLLSGSNHYMGTVVSYNPLPTEKAVGCVPLQKDLTAGRYLLHLAAISAALALGLDPNKASLNESMDRLTIGNQEWDLGADQEIQARWTESAYSFAQFKFDDVLSAPLEVNKKRFEKKIVIIGDIRNGIDSVETPAFDSKPGVYFVAQLVNTFLMRRSLNPHQLPVPTQNALAIVVASLASTAVLCSRRQWKVVFPALLLILGATLPTLLTRLFSTFSESLIMTLPIGGACGASAIILIFSGGKYDTRIAGEVKTGTVLFVDVKGSTAMTREIGGRGYQLAFSDFMRRAAPEVNRNGGQIERSTGDGFVAIFPKSPLGAYRAAESILAQAEKTAKQMGHEFEVVAGMETGPVTGGFVLENNVKTWSTAGNTVNLSARLLATCEQFGVKIAVGPTAAVLLEEDVRLKPVGEFTPKGFDKPVQVYSLPSP